MTKIARRNQGLSLPIPGRITAVGLELEPKLPFEVWCQVGETLAFVEGAVLWWVGDWLLYADRERERNGDSGYGTKYEEALTALPFQYQTLANAKTVAQSVEFSRRRENLKWAHHAEVAPLDPADQEHWLDWALETAPPRTREELRHAIRTWKRQQAIDAAGPLPDGVFDVILADPPWEYDNTGLEGSAALQYETMALDDIKGLRDTKDLDAHTAENATLFLWVTAPMLNAGFEVVHAWAYTYKASAFWLKGRTGTGFYFGGGFEILLVATRGQHVPDYRGRTLPSNVIDVPRSTHSSKPDEAYQLIEYMYPDARRLELFARQRRRGWKSWGHLDNVSSMKPA
jgi:N6-adenosine-specific RNA methylase IME4